MEGNLNSKPTVTLIDGKLFCMDGVSDIAGFDDGCIILDTSMGRICIEGNDLKIESLSKDGGNIVIRGNVSAFFLSRQSDRKTGFVKKLFG